MTSLKTVVTTSDLIKCDPIQKQLRVHGRKPVMELVLKSVLNCAKGLGILIDPEQATMLSSDIIEVYSHDSIEDCLAVLKNARQGKYSFGHETRKTITMQHFAEWMAQHLENKARARENELNKIKNDVPDKYPTIDYEKYKARKALEKEDKRGRFEKHRDKIHQEEEYQKFKEGYENKKE